VPTAFSDASVKRFRFNSETRDRKCEDVKAYLQPLTAYDLSDIPKGKGNKSVRRQCVTVLGVIDSIDSL